MKDNIGNEIHMGDRVFCFSGKYKNQIQKVASFRTITDELWGETDAVNFTSRDWLTAVNVLSIDALGVWKEITETAGTKGFDALGNLLHTGDTVLFLHAMEMYAEIGIIKSMSEKSCLLNIEENRFGQFAYRKKYGEIISLTAIGKTDIVIKHEK